MTPDQLDNAFNHALKHLDAFHAQLRVSQLRFLNAVQRMPGSTQTELANELDVTLAAVSRAVDVFGEVSRKKSDRQKGLGLVTAERTSDDDRVLTVRLTSKGENFMKHLKEIFNVHLKEANR